MRLVVSIQELFDQDGELIENSVQKATGNVVYQLSKKITIKNNNELIVIHADDGCVFMNSTTGNYIRAVPVTTKVSLNFKNFQELEEFLERTRPIDRS